MSRDYEIGKDIGSLQSDVNILKSGRKSGCDCSGATERAACSPDDWRTAAFISEKAGDIRKAFDKFLRESGIKHADGSPLFLASFVVTRHVFAPPKPDICACCGGGFIGCCGIPGCDPCEPVPITFSTPTSPGNS